ncbi:MAG: NADH-quinone oxidoreductase subunit [Actinomycetota bacterium]|jgi:NADH-quinone oxidoreductase subunit M|nr:NADH-quinone oxidoreductase subunit [Actinomycetota bacterium]
MSGIPWLTILGLVPLVGASGVAAAPRRSPLLAKQIAMATSLLVLVLAIVMCFDFEPDGDRFQFVQVHDWIATFGVQYAVGVDGIALVLIALVALLVPVVILASWHDADPEPVESSAGTDGPPVPEPKRSVKTFFALLLVLETMMIGVFAATDVFLFYVFFEAMLIPMYFLIGSYGGPKRSYAAVKFLLYSLFGGLLMLAAVIGLYVASTRQGPGTFSFEKLTALEFSHSTQILLFLGFFIAFAIKAPLFPFHTWLPDAGAEAPIGGAVLLVGVLDKVGTFGFLRYCLPLFPYASRKLAPYVIVLCVIGILYGALLAMGQKDLKRLVSYTSVAHFGFIGLGCFAFTTQAQTGAVLYMVNHGLSTGALFLCVGFLVARGRSRLVGDYSGIGKVAPVLSGVFLVAGLSSLALPGLSTFVSEFLVLVGTYQRYTVAAVLATIGIIFAALYILLMYQRTMQGPLSAAHEALRDLRGREVLAVAPLLALMIFFGFYPKPLTDIIRPAVNATMHDAGVKDPAPTQLTNTARR